MNWLYYVSRFSFVAVCLVFPHWILLTLCSLNIGYRPNSLKEYRLVDVRHRLHRRLAPNKLPCRPRDQSSMDPAHLNLKSFLFQKQLKLLQCKSTHISFCFTFIWFTWLFLPVISKPNAFCVDKGSRCFLRRIRCILDATCTVVRTSGWSWMVEKVNNRIPNRLPFFFTLNWSTYLCTCDMC